jgi:hypothetical protein
MPSCRTLYRSLLFDDEFYAATRAEERSSLPPEREEEEHESELSERQRRAELYEDATYEPSLDVRVDVNDTWISGRRAHH